MYNIFNNAFVGISLLGYASACSYHIRSLYTNWYDVSFILIGLYGADFFTGIVHLFLDYKLIRVNNKIINNELTSLKSIQKYENHKFSVIDDIAFNFQIHHFGPQKFIENRPFYNPRGQFELMLFLTTPVYFLHLLLLYTISDTWTKRKFFITMFTFIMSATTSQIIHGISHRHKIPYILKLFQTSNIILPKEQHVTHHKLLKYNYAILNGWSNPLFNYLCDTIFYPSMKKLPDVFYTM